MEKRTAFNFYRSYYDVLEDIHRDEDKLTYLLALLDKQFKGIEPSLEGIPKLVYKGQKHSIDKQVEGWENKKGIKLTPTEDPYQDPTEGGSEDPTEPPYEDPSYPPSNDSVMTTEGGSEGGYEDPSLQEQEQGKEEEEEQVEEKEKLELTIEQFGALTHKEKYEYLNLIKLNKLYILVDNEEITLKDYITIQQIPVDEYGEIDEEIEKVFN